MSAAAVWYDGRRLWLNEVLGEELDDPDDPRLTEEQRADLNAVFEGGDGHVTGFLELPVDDPQSAVPPSANSGSLSFSALNHDPQDLRSALLTSFDLPDDVGWLQQELGLQRTLPLTLCTHSWPGLNAERHKMVSDMEAHFDDAVVHFPSVRGWLRAQCAEAKFDSACGVHAKLMLLEFSDRLRVVVTSANLQRKHWCFRGEGVWVQDFPRAAPRRAGSGGHPCDASRLLGAGSFAFVLAHFVAELLTCAPGGRQGGWLSTISAFDFSSAAAHLVPSLPGLFCRARTPGPGSLVMRLHADAAAPAPGCARGCSLAPAADGGWELRSVPAHDAEAPGSRAPDAVRLGRLSKQSVAALRAAQDLGLRVDRSVELLPTGSEDVNTLCGVSSCEGNESDDPKAKSSSGGVRAKVANFMVNLFSWILGSEPTPGGGTLVIRVVAQGSCAGSWTEHMAALLSVVEVNYGLFALHQHLAGEAWLHTEECHYAAITGSLSWPKASWLEDLDRLTGRASDGAPGPAIVAPFGDGPIDSAYAGFHELGRLGAHAPPRHAPGRERVRNHSKIMMRQLRDAAGASYGWLYLGSHNLTKAAWGDLVDDDRDKLWVSNMELGVLFTQPRATHNDAGAAEPDVFRDAPLPFGLPLEPADISDREVREEEFWDWSGNQTDGWEWQDYDDWEDWYSSDWWEDDQCTDWRLRKSAWWWWAPTPP